MVCQDAFILSHTMMMTDLPEQEAVDRFLPPLDLPHRIDDHPRVVGGLDFPHQTEVHRHQQAEAMAAVPAVYAEVQREFQQVFGRALADPVVPYRMEDAEVVLVAMGTLASTVRSAVDAARERGVRAGALRVRMFRPLPVDSLRTHLAGTKRIGILDRDLSPGLGGILWGETRALAPAAALVQGYLVGVGGGDVRPAHIGRLIDDLLSRDAAGEPRFLEVG
jgi:pyruvate/2-oxoacid:ferredoxin oxidoreductase alpha subunit